VCTRATTFRSCCGVVWKCVMLVMCCSLSEVVDVEAHSVCALFVDLLLDVVRERVGVVAGGLAGVALGFSLSGEPVRVFLGCGAEVVVKVRHCGSFRDVSRGPSRVCRRAHWRRTASSPRCRFGRRGGWACRRRTATLRGGQSAG